MPVEDVTRVSEKNCTLESECTTRTGFNHTQTYGNFTKSTDKMTEGQSSLYMANWLVLILIGGTVLVFVAGLFIKRQQMIKERQRREQQYLAYFHSVLPHSRLYGKTESSESTSALTKNDKNISNEVTISNEDSNFTTERGLREIWEGVNNIGLITQRESEHCHSSMRRKKRLQNVDLLTTNDNKQENTIPKNYENKNERISWPDIAISTECDVHKGNVIQPAKNVEIDMTMHKVQNETGIALYSDLPSQDNIQESSYIIWI